MLGKWEKLRIRGGGRGEGTWYNFSSSRQDIEQMWWVSLFVRHEFPFYDMKAARANHCSDLDDWPMSQNGL